MLWSLVVGVGTVITEACLSHRAVLTYFCEWIQQVQCTVRCVLCAVCRVLLTMHTTGHPPTQLTTMHTTLHSCELDGKVLDTPPHYTAYSPERPHLVTLNLTIVCSRERALGLGITLQLCTPVHVTPAVALTKYPPCSRTHPAPLSAAKPTDSEFTEVGASPSFHVYMCRRER